MDATGDYKSPLSEPRNYKFCGAPLFDICNVELQITRICNPVFGGSMAKRAGILILISRPTLGEVCHFTLISKLS